MVLTASLRGCLLLYKMQDWIPVRERLLQDLIRNDAAYKTVRDELRSVIGHAEELIVASDRRVALSMPLIEAAGLGDSALWVTQENHIGIWNPENYGAWIETVDGSENAKDE